MSDETVITARWIFPVASPPLHRGTVTVRGERIVAVGSHGSRTPDLDLGNSAIIPGLVNAHVHLDLSGLRGKVPPGPDFTGWLKQIISHRRQQTREQIHADVDDGLAEALRFGTTLVGDIAGEGLTWPLLSKASCRSIVFRELLGLPHTHVMTVWKDAIRWLDEHPDTETCRSALSPHAPYSVHHSLFRAAGLSGSILAIHLAETLAERELIDEHRGPFVDFLSEVNAWDEDSLVPSLDWILWRGERVPSQLLVHGNYLDPNAAIPPNATVIYCPRTHAAFGHSAHPFREFLARGVRVALGTDSLASNPDLDLLAEARFIHERHPDMPGEQILRMATLSGAEALGWDRDAGSLEAGKSADLVAVPLANIEANPHELLFASGVNESGSRRTMWKGKWRVTPRGESSNPLD